jgi:hypothetical protein
VVSDCLSWPDTAVWDVLVSCFVVCARVLLWLSSMRLLSATWLCCIQCKYSCYPALILLQVCIRKGTVGPWWVLVCTFTHPAPCVVLVRSRVCYHDAARSVHQLPNNNLRHAVCRVGPHVAEHISSTVTAWCSSAALRCDVRRCRTNWCDCQQHGWVLLM